MSGADDVSSAFPGAEILSFPRAASPEAARPPRRGGSASSRPGGSREASSSGGKGEAPDGGDPLDFECARLPLTDLGNAERFSKRFKDRFRFCESLGWLYWDGKRWAKAGATEKVKEAEHETVRAIQREAAAMRGAPDDVLVSSTRGKEVWLSDKIAAWGLASQAAARMAAISNRASAMLTVAVEALDADPMKFCVANGTLHIAKRADGPYVTLHPHDPNDFITKISPVAFDPKATCPRFDRFMDEVQPPDDGRAVQRFLDQWAGLSLTGDISEQKLTFHYGKGRNGKSVWVNTISFVAGDYADSIPVESFMDSGRARAGGQATPDIAGLPGVRMLTTSEPKKGSAFDEGLIKLCTGGDKIKARHLNRDFFGFVPQAKLTMIGNYRPKVSGTDEGILNRLVLVPWPVFIPPERRDPTLFETLKGEAAGILNRLLDGLCTWLDGGLSIPGAVAAATADYRSDSDPLGRFLEACTRPTIGKKVQASDMHAVFSAWAKANGETVWSAKGLSAALKERGIAAKKSVNVYWLDIELTKGVSDFLDVNGNPVRRSDDG